MLTAEQKVQVANAQRAENLKTCLTGKWANPAVAAGRECREPEDLSLQVGTLCKQNLLTAKGSGCECSES